MENEIIKMQEWRDSPIAFIRDFWGLVPERDNDKFIKGKHITWQQHDILLAIEKALKGEAPRRISVVAGHGIGKSTVLSWVTHWFLFTRRNAQIGATSPSANQLFDVLWKEIEVWHKRLPEKMQGFFVWQSSYFRMKEAPETWFARARTGRKENPEAFAGLHGMHVALLGDEASGVPDEIYRAGEGSLTDKDTLVILISNGTRLEGFFYDTHHDDKAHWQTLKFSSLESPIVQDGFAERIKAKYGEDSDEYRFMVLGEFPKGVSMVGGWLPMFSEEDIKNQVMDIGPLMKPALMGVDPSGMGKNKSVWVVRDAFRAKLVGVEAKSSPVSVAEKTVTLATHYEIEPGKVKLDNFGVGANVAQEIALGVRERIHALNVGGKPRDERFLNIRAEMYWLGREWLKKGGRLVRHEDWRQLLTIYYKRSLSGKIQVMSKEEMLRKGWDSPDTADAWALTFVPDEVGHESVRTSDARGGSYSQLTDKEIASMTSIY